MSNSICFPFSQQPHYKTCEESKTNGYLDDKSGIPQWQLSKTFASDIARICASQGIVFSTLPTLIKHATGSTIQATLQNAFKKIDAICHRFEILELANSSEEKCLPGDVVDLYKKIKKNRNYALAGQLEVLTLAKNQLLFFPKSISHLKNLQKLLLTGNPNISLEEVRKEFPHLGICLDAAEKKNHQPSREEPC